MLLLFDVDGTLLLTHGAGVRAMSRAGQRTFGEAFSLEPVMVTRPTASHSSVGVLSTAT
jgi:phosphoglycolate phosphatase-like HAD superfamily hydrolase